MINIFYKTRFPRGINASSRSYPYSRLYSNFVMFYDENHNIKYCYMGYNVFYCRILLNFYFETIYTCHTSVWKDLNYLLL